MPTGPSFSVQDIPFSTFGSWLALSPVTALHTRADDLHLISHQGGLNPVLRLTPLSSDGRSTTTITATPGRLTWTHPSGKIEAAFESPDTLRLRGSGLALALDAAITELTPFTGTYFHDADAHVFTSYETGRRYRVTRLTGRATTRGTQTLGKAERGLTLDGDHWEAAIEEYEAARPPYSSSEPFEAVCAASLSAFTSFADAIAPWRGPDTPAAELAAYVLWSATVRPAGFLGRPSVLMSKHWMNKVWSWDHCFNALALAAGDPELAWDQYQVLFDHQDASGALPDSVTHSEVLFNYVKPPIHGWAFSHLRRRLGRPLKRSELELAHDQLQAWTNFWLTARRAPGSPLPHYEHGNDSGWDNATAFDPERVIETADLSAFLILQMRELANLSTELSRPNPWTTAANQLQKDLFTRLWRGDRFAARGVTTGNTWHTNGLLDLMPIALGADLPPSVAAALTDRLRTHLTEFGLATELPTSPHYRPDGYWRGPIWAPATILIEDGLRRAGHTALADEISTRFRTLCEHSGFAENFNALTGEGLRDRAYTWTASTYLLLATPRSRPASASR
jgi:hypothetical protein